MTFIIDCFVIVLFFGDQYVCAVLMAEIVVIYGRIFFYINVLCPAHAHVEISEEPEVPENMPKANIL
jgi:hypothetical protein